MEIGQLFLNLGIKGADKTVGALTNVKKGLGEVGSMSLEAKAGILGAMYALEQLFASSGRAGTDLTNFNAVTGESVQMLQQYQYAARQVGVSNSDVESSFKTLQSAMAKTAMGQAPPAGLAQVSLALQRAGLGGINQKDVEKFAKQPELLLQRLQQYAGVERNQALKNEVLKSFGISEGMVAGLNRQAFKPEILKKAPTYSDREVGQLDKANVAWSNLGNKVQMAVGHFNAMHGGQLVNDISKIVDQIIKLANAFVKLSEKLKLFEGIGKIFEGWTKIFGVINGEVDTISKGKGGIGKTALNEGKHFVSGLGDAIKGAWMTYTESPEKTKSTTTPPPHSQPSQMIHKLLGSSSSPPSSQTTAVARPHALLQPQSIAPIIKSSTGNNTTQTNNVKIDNHFQHPGTDSKRTSDSMSHHLNKTLRQMVGQAQST